MSTLHVTNGSAAGDLRSAAADPDLDLLNRAAGSHPDVSLICIDRFPGVERFVGLGQLEPAQLASLYPSLAPVTPEQRALATAAWAAFRSTGPRALLDIAEQARADPLSIQALPFLGDALHRFFAEFPSVENGLTRTESLALSALGEAPMTGGTLFGAAQRHEPRPFMGDLTFYRILTTLASARVPLVAIAGLRGQMDLRDHTVEIVDAGRDVLARRRDHVALNGIDTWRGGVHLNGVDRSPWRWDARRKTLVS